MGVRVNGDFPHADEAARMWAAFVEGAEQRRSGVALAVARRSVARRLRVAAGTLDELARKRVKGVRLWVFERLRDAFIREAEAEIKRLEHEIAMARAAGGGLGVGETRQVVAHIEALRALLREDHSNE